mgnify:CR=1 FL=1
MKILLTLILVLLVLAFIGLLFVTLMCFSSGHKIPASTSTFLLGSAGVVLLLIGGLIYLRKRM